METLQKIRDYFSGKFIQVIIGLFVLYALVNNVLWGLLEPFSSILGVQQPRIYSILVTLIFLVLLVFILYFLKQSYLIVDHTSKSSWEINTGNPTISQISDGTYGKILKFEGSANDASNYQIWGPPKYCNWCEIVYFAESGFTFYLYVTLFSANTGSKQHLWLAIGSQLTTEKHNDEEWHYHLKPQIKNSSWTQMNFNIIDILNETFSKNTDWKLGSIDTIRIRGKGKIARISFLK